jgi:hypothetical protein
MDFIHNYLVLCSVVIVISFILLSVYKYKEDDSDSDYVESNAEYRIYLQ